MVHAGRESTMPRMRLVREVMKHRDPVTARPDDTAQAAAERMAAAGCGSVLVCNGDRLCGIFTERDLLARVVAPGLDPRATRLEAVMTPDPDTIESTDTAREAVRRMDEFGYRHLAVVEEGRLVGVLSLRDLPIETLARMQPELDQRHTLTERLR
jgi:CBS domain-containing protein